MSFPLAAFQDYNEGYSSWHTLNRLLDALLKVTQSQYGFIGRKSLSKENVLALQLEAVTNIAWSPELEKVCVVKHVFE